MGENKEKKRTESSYFKHGLMILIVGVLLILFYYVVNHFDDFEFNISKFVGVFRPFIIGAVIAYLLCPIFNFFTNILNKSLQNKAKDSLKLSKTLSTIITMLIFLGLATGFIWMIIPGVIESISNVIPKIEPAFDSVSLWITETLNKNEDLASMLSGQLDGLSDKILTFAQEKLLPASKDLMSTISTAIVDTIGVIVDIIISIVVCIYVLNSKEKFIAQGRKIVYANCTKVRANNIFEFFKLVDDNFGGFINGKIVDSLIIGVICAISMLLLNIPLVPLVSVVVTVTNVIPFFGPFIGAIPSILLILMIEPIAALKFLIMIVILQQLDGNVIGPSILGKTTKLSGFWVLFAIIVGGDLFGFIGMIVAVPLFAIIYTYIARSVNQKLKKKDLAIATSNYEDNKVYEKKYFEPKKKERKVLKKFNKKNNDK